jgi:hypothetical protein
MVNNVLDPKRVSRKPEVVVISLTGEQQARFYGRTREQQEERNCKENMEFADWYRMGHLRVR